MNRHNLSYSNVVKPTPTKKQAVLIPADSDTNLIEYVVGLGRIIGPNNIISASKISKNRICIYLDSENTVNSFMESGGNITVNNKLIQARKLVSPSKRLILSNVHTCVPNSIILEALHEKKIKTISAIHNLHIGTISASTPNEELAKYKHITSFRRAVYIEEPINVTIPDSLLIYFDNETHRIFISDNEQRCHVCGEQSHNADVCPKSQQPLAQTLLPEETHAQTFDEKLKSAREIRDRSPQENTAPETDYSQSPMDSTNTPFKRPLSTSSEKSYTPSQSSSQDATRKTNKKKKKKKLHCVAKNPTTPSENGTSHSDTDSDSENPVSTPTDDTNDSPDSVKEAALTEILAPTSVIFKDSEGNQPIAFQDMVEFLQQCVKPKNAPAIAPEFTDDIPGLIKLLDQCYALINDRGIKNRITRIKKALTPT